MKMLRRDFFRRALGVYLAGGCAGLSGCSLEDNKGWKETLADHKLAKLEIETIQMKYPRLVGKNSRKDIHGRGPRDAICKITTNYDVSGWGAFRGGQKAAKQLRDKYKGISIAELIDPSIGVIRQDAIRLDFALHDLAGNILGIPVYEMLGGNGPMSSMCYSGMIYFDDLEPEGKPEGINKVLANCQADVDLGYRQLKAKIGRGNKWMKPEDGLERDIEVTLAIGRAFPEIDILVDGNDGMPADQLLRYLEALGDLELFWIEEPFRENHEGFARLKNWLRENKKKTYIADGEANPDEKQLLALCRDGLLDVYLTDIRGYGFTNWRKLMPVLKQMGITSSPHAWGTALKTNYVAHLAAGLGNVVTVEGVTCASEQVDLSGYQLKKGKITPPAEPGFGMKLLI